MGSSLPRLPVKLVPGGKEKKNTLISSPHPCPDLESPEAKLLHSLRVGFSSRVPHGYKVWVPKRKEGSPPFSVSSGNYLVSWVAQFSGTGSGQHYLRVILLCLPHVDSAAWCSTFRERGNGGTTAWHGA
jgi:hypothetical protein